MNSPQIPISWGELLDKITILQIKLENLTSQEALNNVAWELEQLQSIFSQSCPETIQPKELELELKKINQQLWDIEDKIRDKEKQINSVKEITNTANNLMEKYAVLKGYLIKTMSSFNAQGDNLKKVIQGAYGRNGLEQRIEKLKDLGVNSTRPITKTSAVEDEIIQLDTIENKNKESVKKIYS